MKFHVNRALLPVKAVYFTHLAGLASLVPYLPLYMSHLGLTATQIGLIRGLEPLLALLFTHMWGSIADSFNQHRAILLTAIGGATVFLFGTFFVPSMVSVVDHNAPNNATQIPDMRFVNLAPDFRSNGPPYSLPMTTHSPRSDTNYPFLYDDVQSKDDLNMCESLCPALNDTLACELEHKVLQANDISAHLPYRTEPCAEVLCFMRSEKTDQNRTSLCEDKSVVNGTGNCSYPESVSNCLKCNVDVVQRRSTLDNHWFLDVDAKCSIINSTVWLNTSSGVSIISSANLSNPTRRSISCHCQELDVPLEEEPGQQNIKDMSTFFLLLILVLFSRSFMCTTSPILQSTTMELLEQKTDDFGKQRIWGAFGWGALALISGILIDQVAKHSKDRRDHFDPAFYLFLGFMLAALVAATFIVFPFQTSIKAQCQRVPQLIRKPEILGFLVTVCVLGMGFGVIGTFMFLFLQEMHASHTLMGLTLTLTCVSEIPFLFVSNHVIRYTGHIGALCFSLFCYTVRFLGYSLITNPWAVIPFELLHGITYGLSWAACTSYANQNAPPGLAVTLQAVVSSVHMGFGKGLGTIVGGLVYDHFGSRNLFRASACVVGLSGLLYLGLYHVFTKRHPPVLYNRFRGEESSSRMSSRRESISEGRVTQSIEMDSTEIDQLEEDPPSKLDARSMRLALRDINRPASPPTGFDPSRPGTSSQDLPGTYRYSQQVPSLREGYHQYSRQVPPLGGGYQRMQAQHLVAASTRYPPQPPPAASDAAMMVKMPCGYYHKHDKRRMDSLEDVDDGSPGATSLAALIHSEQGRPQGMYGIEMERVMLHNMGMTMTSYLDDVDLDQAMDAV